MTAIAPEERFWASVNKTDGCWQWTASKDRSGYGWFNGFGEKKAHRASYAMHFGPIPDGKLICHHCDNPSCVRPDHIYAGDPADNVRDMVVRQRSKGINAGDRNGMRRFAGLSAGSRNANAVLTEDMVVEIRNQRARGTATDVIASTFGIHRVSIDRICAGKTWTHAGGPILTAEERKRLWRESHQRTYAARRGNAAQ